MEEDNGARWDMNSESRSQIRLERRAATAAGVPSNRELDSAPMVMGVQWRQHLEPRPDRRSDGAIRRGRAGSDSAAGQRPRRRSSSREDAELAMRAEIVFEIYFGIANWYAADTSSTLSQTLKQALEASTDSRHLDQIFFDTL